MFSEKLIKHPELQGQFPCNSCSHQAFAHAASLRRHREENHNDETLCLLCNTRLEKNETVKLHMKNKHELNRVYTCGCCYSTFPGKIEFSSHLRAIRLNDGRANDHIIARTVEAAEVFKQGSGSVSPTTTSSSAESSAPSTAPISPVAATVPAVTQIVEEEKIPVRSAFQNLLNDKVELMLSNGLYSDDQLVMVETWIEIIEKATEYVKADLKNTKTRRGRPVKRPLKLDS
uniref:C2H2-type domain-containing protein n=1 Tax=Caenorhabditis tropicalis TaxID=1561998 RepID=A0A1I7TYV6_9PELO